MALVCSSCGNENRENARYCSGCARPLDALGGSLDVEAARRERIARARRRAERRKAAGAVRGQRNGAPATGRSPWVVILVVAVLLLAGGWWMTRNRVAVLAPASPPRALGGGVPSSVLSTASASVPASEPPAAAGAPAEDTAATAVERLRESVQRLEQEDRLREAALAQQRQKLPEPRRHEEARRHTDALSAEAAQAAEQAPAPQKAPEAPAVVADAPVGPAAGNRTVGASVDQLCADSGNVFARDFCRIRECGKAAFASDPVCVRFRQMDEARRREAEYH